MRYNRTMEGNLGNPERDTDAMQTVSTPLSQAGGLAFSIAAVAFLVVGFVIGLIVLFFKIPEKTDLYVYLSYLAAPVALGGTVAFIVKQKKLPIKETFPLKCHPKYYLIGLLLIFGLLFFAAMVDAPVIELFKLMGYKPRPSESYFPTLTGGWVVLALLVIAVSPAIFEEALFRGVILNTCEKSMGTVRTVFVVGFAFALFHGSPEQTVYQFITGCALAFIALRSGSVLPSVMMHFINNALIVIFAACGLFDEAGNLVMSDTANIIITVLAGLCFFGSIIWLILDKKQKPVIKCRKGGVAAFFIFASVGIAVMGLNWILSFFISG